MFDTSPHHNKERSWQQARINIGEQRSPAVSWKINTLWGSLGWEESKQEDPLAILLARDALIYTIYPFFRWETWKKQLGVAEQKTYRSFSARHLGMIQLRFDWATEYLFALLYRARNSKASLLFFGMINSSILFLQCVFMDNSKFIFCTFTFYFRKCDFTFFLKIKFL